MYKIIYSRGFTLIELMVVISIISMFSSVTVATLGSSRSQAVEVKKKVEVLEMGTVLKLYQDNKGSAPISKDSSGNDVVVKSDTSEYVNVLQPLVDNKLISKIPTSPDNIPYYYYNDSTVPDGEGATFFTYLKKSGIPVYVGSEAGIVKMDQINNCANGMTWNGFICESKTIFINGSLHSITASAGANGSISPSGVTTVNPGASQIYTITPDSGYQVVSVTVDGVSQEIVTSYTFSNVTTNHTINVEFSAILSSRQPICNKLGDVNDDGVVNDSDINYMRQGILGIQALTSEEIRRGDVNASGSVSTLDITLVRRYILGITSAFSACKPSPCNNLGDLDNDGYLTENDIDIVRRGILGISTFTEEEKRRGDVNLSGSVSTLDITLIRRVILGIETTFSGCNASQ